MSVSAVIFDLDGVLIETEHINVLSATAAFREFGCELEHSDAATIVGRHPVDYVPDLAKRFGLTDEQIKNLIRFQNETYIKIWNEEAGLTSGADEVVRELHGNGKRLVLATSAGRKHATKCLAKFELNECFEFLLTKDDVSRRKPDPEIYLEGLRRLDLQPEQVLVVEDSEHGVAAAKAAGLRCVAVRTKLTPVERIEAADEIIDSLMELLLLAVKEK